MNSNFYIRGLQIDSSFDSGGILALIGTRRTNKLYRLLHNREHIPKNRKKIEAILDLTGIATIMNTMPDRGCKRIYLAKIQELTQLVEDLCSDTKIEVAKDTLRTYARKARLITYAEELLAMRGIMVLLEEQEKPYDELDDLLSLLCSMTSSIANRTGTKFNKQPAEAVKYKIAMICDTMQKTSKSSFTELKRYFCALFTQLAKNMCGADRNAAHQLLQYINNGIRWQRRGYELYGTVFYKQ